MYYTDEEQLRDRIDRATTYVLSKGQARERSEWNWVAMMVVACLWAAILLMIFS